MLQGFYEIKKWINSWEKHCIKENKISDVLDQNQFIIFFQKDGTLYGGKEDDRLIFAKLKNNDTEDPMHPNFKKEAVFTGIDLKKAFKNGISKPEEFNYKDIKNIKVCDKKEAIRILGNK